MPYYGSGDYYAAGGYYRGDYYQAGGIFGSIGKALGKVAKVAVGLTPVGRVASAVLPIAKQLIAGAPRPRPGGLPLISSDVDYSGGGMDVNVPAYRGSEGRNGGRKGHFKKDGTWTDRARPRMQVTNTRALRRAGRRVRGFLRVARALGALPVARGKGKRLFRAKRK